MKKLTDPGNDSHAGAFDTFRIGVRDVSFAGAE